MKKTIEIHDEQRSHFYSDGRVTDYYVTEIAVEGRQPTFILRNSENNSGPSVYNITEDFAREKQAELGLPANQIHVWEQDTKGDFHQARFSVVAGELHLSGREMKTREEFASNLGEAILPELSHAQKPDQWGNLEAPERGRDLRDDYLRNSGEREQEAEQNFSQTRTFAIQLDNGEKRLLEVEGLRPDQDLTGMEMSDKLMEALEKQKPDEPLKINAEEFRQSEKPALSPESPDEQKPQLEQENQARIFELELDNGEKRLLEVEGLRPDQDLNDVEMSDELIEALEKQKPDEPLKISVEPMREEHEQQQKQTHGLGH